MTSRYLLKVEADVDSAVEAEFNEWYTHRHLPEIVNLPGFSVGTRYRLVPDNDVFPHRAHARYLALYGFNALTDLLTPQFEFARGFDSFSSAVTSSASVHEVIVSRGKRDGGRTMGRRYE